MKLLLVVTLLLAAAVDSAVSSDCQDLVCDTVLEPVCGSNGNTYSNRCKLEIANCHDSNIKLAYTGACLTYYNGKNENDDKELLCEFYMKGEQCTEEKNPVCGTDGKTYPNKCALCEAKFDNYRLHLKHSGPCSTKMNNWQVSEKISLIQPGCTEQVLKIDCTQDEFPLCGSNGVTYGNNCKFCKAKYHLKKHGINLTAKATRPCTVDDICSSSKKNGDCTLVYSPICASDGRTFLNICAMCTEMYKLRKENKDTLSIAHRGLCENEMLNDEINAENSKKCSSQERIGECSTEQPPVCGSDLKTYDSKCHFCRDTKDTEITIKYFGKCLEEKLTTTTTPPINEVVQCDETKKPERCIEKLDPICASNGVTYPNKCSFCSAKYVCKEEGKNLMAIRKGECIVDDFCPPASKAGACTYEIMPVCASDGKTYDNLCLMCSEIYSKRKEGDFTYQLSVEHEGKCKISYYSANEDICQEFKGQSLCTSIYKPVCASDGKSYANKCLFCREMYEQLENGTQLTIRANGECPTRCPPASKLGVCTYIYSPVCGSNNETYQNECFLCADMYARQKAGENVFIYVKYKGSCGDGEFE